MLIYDCLHLQESLYLSFDYTPGEIPSELGNLTRLKLLSMRGVSLKGEIPSFIFNISSMISLDLANNSLYGSLPVGMHFNLPNLEWMLLYSNKLTGQIFLSLMAMQTSFVLIIVRKQLHRSHT